MSNYKFRTRFRKQGTETEFLFILPFNSSNGKRRDIKTKKIVPLYFIKKLQIYLREKLVSTMILGPNISRYPLFGVFLRDAREKDQVIIRIVDNHGQEQIFRTEVKFYKRKPPKQRK